MDALLMIAFWAWLTVCLAGAAVALHDVWTIRRERQ
jgi:hypothetical protein